MLRGGRSDSALNPPVLALDCDGIRLFDYTAECLAVRHPNLSYHCWDLPTSIESIIHTTLLVKSRKCASYYQFSFCFLSVLLYYILTFATPSPEAKVSGD